MSDSCSTHINMYLNNSCLYELHLHGLVAILQSQRLHHNELKYSIPVGSVASSSWFNRWWSDIYGEENSILYSLHSNSQCESDLSFSAVCVLLCPGKSIRYENALSQTSHLKGFSRQCELFYAFSNNMILKLLSHRHHT